MRRRLNVIAAPGQLKRYALTIMATHRLSIADPMFFEGPDGANTVFANGVGVIKGSPAYQVPLESYLLSVVHPFVVDGDDVHQLIVTPRFVGDELHHIIHGASGVNIARVKPGIALNAGDTYDGSEAIGWGVGMIHPARA